MKILAVGGGSGGHVTPVAAVLSELKKAAPSAEMRFWCDRKFESQARSIMQAQGESIPVDVIMAGKLRRYHHLTFLQHIMIPSILFPNIVDFSKVMLGFIQSFIKLLVWRPDVVFTKGGYVCLPVGWAASLLRIPLVIHDSDAHPGLTNRLLARHATTIATGAPLEYYSYPKGKSQYIGIPISRAFIHKTVQERQELKIKLGLDASKPLIVITGGGLGAKRINDYIDDNVNILTDLGTVVLISGAGQYDELRTKHPKDTDSFILKAFVSEGMADLLAAADVVVARAGATTILELAAVGAPTILIPNARLTGGHQVKNAKVYSDVEAAFVIEESKLSEQPKLLLETITTVIHNKQVSLTLTKNILQFAKPDAAKHMAEIILSATKNP
jgi:UDP-N-acetylglucosamine--N-acetylmuramyl-(pentapeptide) pyrophosphoryl-undecaprenol N-acetylglucosamine transferase